MTTAEKATVRQSNYVPLNGIKLYYEEAGQGQPLILLHGGGQTCQDWAKHVPILAQQFRVLALDSRGHGRSVDPGATLSYALMADDLAAFIQWKGLEKPILCGWSDGANIALEIGMRYPDLAGGLVCCGLYTRLSRQYRRALKEMMWFQGPGRVDLSKWEEAYPGLVQEWKDSGRFVYSLEHMKTLIQQLSVLFLTPLGYTLDDYRKISAPTLVLSGDRDQFYPVEENIKTYRLLPHAELAIVPNADHFFPDNQREVFIDIVSTFCRRHRAGEGLS